MTLLLASPLTLFAPLLWALLFVLLFCVVYWAITKLFAAFGIGNPVRDVVIVILVLIAVLSLVYWLATSYGVL